jgi:DNA-binding response OmpR family regulator
MAKRAVLVVEDDDATRHLLRAVLCNHAAVSTAGDGQTAVELLRSNAFDTVILDIMLPKLNGFQVAEVIRGIQPRPKLIVLSGLSRYFGDRFPEGTVMLQKPFEIDHLEAALSSS